MVDRIDEEKALWNNEDLNAYYNYGFIIILPFSSLFTISIFVYEIIVNSEFSLIIPSLIIGIVLALLVYFICYRFASVYLSKNQKTLIIKRLFQKNIFVEVGEIQNLWDRLNTISFCFNRNGKIEEVVFYPESDPFLFFSSHPTYLRLKELKRISNLNRGDK